MNIGEKIKKARSGADLSLSKLSEITKISKSTLQRYETNSTKKIPVDVITVLEKALKLQPGYLLGIENNIIESPAAISKKIRLSRKQRGISITELSEKTGIPKQKLDKYEIGIVNNMPLTDVATIANCLNVSPSYLMGWEDENGNDIREWEEKDSITELSKKYDNIRPIEKKRFPVLGEIACGQPMYANQDYETFIEASADIKADFCLLAHGDSMINARIFDGDIVFIRRQPDVENGEIAAVVIDDEATLKRVYKYPNRLELRPENPVFDVLNYEGEELNHIRILGKAIAFQSNVK